MYINNFHSDKKNMHLLNGFYNLEIADRSITTDISITTDLEIAVSQSNWQIQGFADRIEWQVVGQVIKRPLDFFGE